MKVYFSQKSTSTHILQRTEDVGMDRADVQLLTHLVSVPCMQTAYSIPFSHSHKVTSGVYKTWSSEKLWGLEADVCKISK